MVVYSNDLGLWRIGESVGCDSNEWVFKLEIWVCGKIVGSKGWWRSMGFRVGDQWVGGFKFLGLQIDFWV